MTRITDGDTLDGGLGSDACRRAGTTARCERVWGRCGPSG